MAGTGREPNGAEIFVPPVKIRDSTLFTLHQTFPLIAPVFRTLCSFARPLTRRTLCAAAVTVLAASGCDKVKARLYPEAKAPVDEAWLRDSAFVAREPRILLRTVKVGNQELLMPIAVLANSNLRNLRMSKRGWIALDISAFGDGQTVIPVRNGLPGSPAPIRQRMWEKPGQPLDSIPLCPNMIPVIKAALPEGTSLAILNYKLPTNMKSLSADEIESALSVVPNLVAPTLGIKGAQLARYKRSVHQILRTDGPPAVLAEYHDDGPQSDTGTVASRRPRHLTVVLEKGVYGYRASWNYATTGSESDRPILRYIDSMDVDGDGRSELFFGVTIPDGTSYTIVFRQKHDSWVEMWRRPPVRCDVR